MGVMIYKLLAQIYGQYWHVEVFDASTLSEYLGWLWPSSTNSAVSESLASWSHIEGF